MNTLKQLMKNTVELQSQVLDLPAGLLMALKVQA